MAHPLDDCIARLNRAHKQIGQLKRMVTVFLRQSPPPYGYDIVPDPDLGTFEFDLIGRVNREPDSLRLGLVIADVVNNLRAALDNLVWQLSVLEQARHGVSPPPDPIPRKGPGCEWRKVAFPIVTGQPAWDPTAAMLLRFVGSGIRTPIKDLQPFVTGQKTGQPEREPLAVLDELWNIDKHRHLHIGQWYAGLYAVTSGFHDFFQGAKERGWDYKIIRQSIGPFVDGTNLGRVEIIQNDVVGPAPWMYVKAQLAFDVAFEKEPPAYGGQLIPTLRLLHQTISGIVRQFESEFP